MDKVDAYDKEQLQAMGWLFDETETPDTAVRFIEQDLTSEQQMQARANIGIVQGLLNDADFIAELKTKLGIT